MTALAQYAAELDALVRDGRRIRLGDRNFEKPHADLDALLANLTTLADRIRLGVPVALIAANDGAVHVVPTATVTGRGQVLCSIARPRR